MKMAQRQCCQHSPLAGSMKLNVDGAVFIDQQKIGVGIILKDIGKIIMVASKKEYEVKDPVEIELLAILRGL